MTTPRWMTGVLSLLAALGMTVIVSAAPPRLYVKADATGLNDGSSWDNAFTDLQSALDGAISGTEIYVAKGTYCPSSYNGLVPGDPADERLKHFRLADGVEIYGGLAGNENLAVFDLATRDFAANETILSGNIGAPDEVTDNCYHVIYNYYSDPANEYTNQTVPLDVTAVLDGFTITGGQSEFWGTHGDGAGMHNNQCSPTVRHCRFFSNVTARWGGGMYNTTNSSPQIEDCRFEDNVAGVYGGGGANYNSLATFARTIFTGNSASYSGGAMANSVGSHTVMTDCEFRDNTAGEYGGAIYNWNNSSPAFHNCLFVGNVAETYGGGAISSIEHCHPLLRSCTIADNTADGFAGNGGAMFNWKNSDPVCYNTIFWGNSATSNNEIYNHPHIDFDPSVPEFAHCDIAGSGGSGVDWDTALGTDSGGNLDADPQFANAAGGNYRLATGSPCIDAGQNVSALMPTDLDGFARIVDGDGDLNAIVDIGAYEYQIAELTLSTPTGGTIDPIPDLYIVGVGAPFAIAAIADVNYLFTHWTVAGPGTLGDAQAISTTVTVTAPAPVTVTANFAETTLLTMAASPADKGTTLPGAGVYTVAVGVSQAISATPIVGWHFDTWSVDAGNAVIGNALDAETVITVTDNGGATVSANFAINTYVVNFVTDGTPDAYLTGSTVQTVTHGANCTPVTAWNPPAGFFFVNWTLDGVLVPSGTQLTVTNVTSNRTYVANFAPGGQLAPLILATEANGTTAPAPYTYYVQVDQGTAITAVPDSGYEFFGWEVTAGSATLGDPLSASTVVTVTAAVATTITATFGQYALLTVIANPAEGGTVTPALPVTVVVGAPVDLSAIRNHGFGFLTWSVGDGDALIANPLSGDTVVTVTSVAGATVFANFAEFDRLAVGSTFAVDAADLTPPLLGFTVKPKVYGLYDHPFSGKLGLKATVKVLTKDFGDLGAPTTILCEWTKKVKLYDAKAFKAAQKAGVSADTWLDTPANQQGLENEIHVASKEVPGGDQSLRHVLLAAPEIITVTAGFVEGAAVLIFEGNWFGTKAPKIWREYEVDDGAGGIAIKQQKLKVLKPEDLDFLDSKNKPACMNAATGKSKAIAVIPTKLPKGELNGILVLENGVGMGTHELIP